MECDQDPFVFFYSSNNKSNVKISEHKLHRADSKHRHQFCPLSWTRSKYSIGSFISQNHGRSHDSYTLPLAVWLIIVKMVSQAFAPSHSQRGSIGDIVIRYHTRRCVCDDRLYLCYSHFTNAWRTSILSFFFFRNYFHRLAWKRINSTVRNDIKSINLYNKSVFTQNDLLLDWISK